MLSESRNYSIIYAMTKYVSKEATVTGKIIDDSSTRSRASNVKGARHGLHHKKVLITTMCATYKYEN